MLVNFFFSVKIIVMMIIRMSTFFVMKGVPRVLAILNMAWEDD